MKSQFPTKMGRMVNMSASEEQACLAIAQKISVILCTYVDPYGMRLYPARGFWSHGHQDVQRFTGFVPRPELPSLKYTMGSWYLTLSDIGRGKKFTVADRRGDRLSDADFVIHG